VRRICARSKISNLRTKEGLQDLNVLYDTGSRFIDRHLIYRKIDVHDKQPKVYKIDGERPGLSDVDSPVECEGESIYILQFPEDKEAVQKEIQPTARM